MPRQWTDLDTDAHRLPPGFTRTGYDSNTRRYHFSDAQGRMYQGEPGEEFGGRLIPINTVDSTMKYRFAPDDDEVECEEETTIDGPPSPPEPDSPLPIFTPARPTPTAFSDFLATNQMAAATSPKPKPPQQQQQKQQQQQSNRGFAFSLKRAGTSIMRLGSAKSKNKTGALTSSPSPRVDEWGGITQPHSAKF